MRRKGYALTVTGVAHPTPSEILARRGAAVRARRIELGLTQSDLSELIGAHQTTVSQIELGQCETSLRLSLAIASALKTTHDALFGVDAEVA